MINIKKALAKIKAVVTLSPLALEEIETKETELIYQLEYRGSSEDAKARPEH